MLLRFVKTKKELPGMHSFKVFKIVSGMKKYKLNRVMFILNNCDLM